MLSKLFAHIKIGSGFWQFAVLLIIGCANFFKVQGSGGASYIPAWIGFSAAAVLLIGSSFGLNDLGNYAFTTSRKNLYAGLILALLWGVVPGSFYFSQALLPFLIVALFYNLFKVSEHIKDEMYPYLLNAGFLSFVAWIISPVGWLFMFIVAVSSFMQSKITLRELLLPWYSFGFCVFIFFCVSYISGAEEALADVWERNNFMQLDQGVIIANKSYYILFTVMLLMSIPQFFAAMGKASLVKRKWMSVMMISYLLLMAGSVLWSASAYSFFLCALVPLSLLFANYLQFLSKWWMKEGVFWLLIALNIAFIWL